MVSASRWYCRLPYCRVQRTGSAAVSLWRIKLLGSEPWQRLCSQPPFSQGSDVRRQAAHYTMEPAAGKSTFQAAKGILSVNNLDKQCILESIVCTPTVTSQYHFPTAAHLRVCRVRAVTRFLMVGSSWLLSLTSSILLKDKQLFLRQYGI